MNNGSEGSAAWKAEERSRLGNKPILEWSREDWQLWAAGLNESQAVDSQAVEPQPVESQPVESQAVESQAVEPKPVEPKSVENRQAPEPVKAAMGADSVTEASVEADESPSRTGSASGTVSANSTVPTQDPPVEVLETPSSALPERSPAAPPSTGLNATRPWPGPPSHLPERTGRVRARSALGLIMLAVVVGALMAGLVTFVIVVGGLVLRRAFGS